jgi:DNA polymerase-1
MEKKLYLIDGTALLYRAHFAFIKNPLINSKGQNTSAIFGVINSFIRLLEGMNAEYIAISFDRKAPTFRHEMYDKYKAQRPPMPDDLVAQIEPVKQFFHMIGLAEISLDGYEADDVLGTLAARFKNDFEVVLVTSDKDYCQLVDSKSTLYDPMKDVRLDREAVFHKYGIWPEQFIDYLALVGDSSDNIPGVKSIGPKTAEALLKDYHSLDGIYGNLDKLAPKLKERLENDHDNAYLSKTLATIECNVPIPTPTLSELAFKPEELRHALPLLSEYEINVIKRKIETKYPEPSKPQPNEEYQDDIFAEAKPSVPELNTIAPIAVTEQQFEAILVTSTNFVRLLNELKSATLISIDTETDSIDPMQAALVGISLCVDTKKAYYLPVAHKLAENLSLSEVLKHLPGVLKDKLLIGHNLKYDLIVLSRHNLPLNNPIFDTMLAAYILDPGTMGYSLDACALRELSYQMQPISELIGKGKSQITFDLVDVNEACFYAAEDAWSAFMLYPVYRRKLDFSSMVEVYDKIDLPLIRVLKTMEETGVAIDSGILGEISHLINTELKKLIEDIYSYAGYEFNLNSTQQLAKLLFEEKKLPNRKKTKTGYSTDNSVLEDLAAEYKIAESIIQYRQLTKLQSTYISALPKMINPETGRIHSSFNQTVASTGRLSSSNPNLQNIPVRTELGREIRKAFCAKDSDHVILAADYSQIELRLLALMSRDEMLIEAFRNGLDIHKGTASRIYNVPLDEVTQDQRRAAKTINFGILYGMGQRKLARDLGISQSEAKSIIESYFAQFPSIRNFIAQCVAKAHQEHYCDTIFGRRLYLPNITSKNQGLKSEAERVAVNMPIQGSAADLIKLAMIDLHAKIANNPQINMILQVHDELVFEVHIDALEEAKRLVRTAMESALPLEYRKFVELKTDIGVGKNWFEAH